MNSTAISHDTAFSIGESYTRATGYGVDALTCPGAPDEPVDHVTGVESGHVLGPLSRADVEDGQAQVVGDG